MLRVIEQQKEADKKAALVKRDRNTRMVAEAEVSNNIAQDRKAEKLRKEREEDLKIVRYNAERIAKEEAQIAE